MSKREIIICDNCEREQKHPGYSAVGWLSFKEPAVLRVSSGAEYESVGKLEDFCSWSCFKDYFDSRGSRAECNRRPPALPLSSKGSR